MDFIDETDKEVYADSAYAGKELPKHVTNHVHEKGCRYKSLTAEQKEGNRIKSKTRARIEHVFGFMTMSMHGLTVDLTYQSDKNRFLFEIVPSWHYH